VIGFGVLFLRLHALPEHIAHGSQKVQMELVSVLCLIALFTHMHIFWIAALILAFVEIPDFGHPLRRIAGSVEKMAGVKPDEGAGGQAPTASAQETAQEARRDGAIDAPRQHPAAAPAKPVVVSTTGKELRHV
jgi:hypothetical protein